MAQDRFEAVESKLDGLVRLMQGLPCAAASPVPAERFLVLDSTIRKISERLEQLEPSRVPIKDVYTVAEARIVLGFKTTAHVRKLLKEGELRGYKADAKTGDYQEWRITKEALMAFTAQRDRELPED